MVAALSLMSAMPLHASPTEDALASLHSWLDKFNAGDMDAFYAGHADNAVIVDEFAPYIWTGPKVAQSWARDYSGDAEKQGISDPRMDYAAPIRAESDGRFAYVVLPTVYRFKQGGHSMSAAGTMTFVMLHQASGWKIASWTYSAGAPGLDR
jgi:ketosteroid isomerase-like protein